MKVIITGASRGIGAGIARALASAGGFNLGLTARSFGRLEALQQVLSAQGAECSIAACDVRDPDQVARAFADLIARMEGVDALVNNAAVIVRKSIEDIGFDEWRDTMETNINGPFYATRAVLPHMKETGRGHIVNISSISGCVPLPGGSAYAASKFALRGLSQSMFQELRDYGIKTTTVYPGSVDSQSHRHDPDADHSWKVTPEEVGESIVHLLRTAPGTVVSELEIRPLSRPPGKS
jgi:hypothetical protein